MMRRKNVFIMMLIVLLGFNFSSRAAAPDSLMVKANAAYNQQQYDSAVNLYQKVLQLGVESPGVYYNLGNAYFRLKEIPSAILYYEKAKKLSPNDPDIQYNLNMANSMIVDKIDKVPELFIQRWWNYFYNLFDADTWAVLSLVFFALLVLMIGIFIRAESRRMRKTAFFTGLLLLLLTLGSFGLASQRSYYTKNHTEAIVFTPAVTVKSSPSINSVDLFVVHEGTKIKVLDEVDNWVKIKIQNGSIGWLPQSSVKKI